MSFSYEKILRQNLKDMLNPKDLFQPKTNYNFNWVDDKTCEGA